MEWSGWCDFPCTPLSADLQPMGAGRPPGLHLGEIIHRMKVAAGERVGPIPGEDPNLRMQQGFLWESALEYVQSGMTMDEAMELSFKRYMRALRQDVCKQIRLEKDGIHMTPDGVNYSLGESESYKFTYRKLPSSQDDFEERYWSWLTQEKAYLYSLGMDTVHWIVLFAAGDYSKGPGSGPKMLISTGTFTASELVQNWNNVLHHAEGLRNGN